MSVLLIAANMRNLISLKINLNCRIIESMVFELIVVFEAFELSTGQTNAHSARILLIYSVILSSFSQLI